MIYKGPSIIRRTCTIEPCDGSEPVDPYQPEPEPEDPTGGVIDLIIK